MLSPPRLRINVVANVLGRLSSMLLAVIFTPLYIRFLGIEAYGLIGFYVTLQSSISFMEMGLGRACNWELARQSGRGEAGHRTMLDTLRSLEVVYWLAAVVIGGGISLLSSWIAGTWLNADTYTSAELASLLLIMAWVIGLRWPVGLYTGALMGLQRQVWVNVALFAVSLLNWGGSVLVLWLVRADIQLFFWWQMVVALFAVSLFAWLAWRAMPGSLMRGHFSWSRLKEIFPFAAGVGGNAIMGLLLRQSDKLILSAMLPLKQFGLYTLASMIAGVTAMLATPVSNAVFPRFSQLVESRSGDLSLSPLYHLSSQAVAGVVVPYALVVALFAPEVLSVYTGNVELADGAASILTVLALAKMLHAYGVIPYALQLAYGWLKLSLMINLLSVLWLLPAVYLLTDIYGPVGAAFAWLVVTVGYVVIGMPLMHRRFLVGEFWRWLWSALVIPLVTVASFLFIVQSVYLDNLEMYGRWQQGATIFGVGVAAFLLSISVLPDLRRWLAGLFLSGK